MSLNWSVEKCEDADLLISEDEWATTEYLIWTTISVGIGDITEKTEAEFYARMKVMDDLYGCSNSITPQDIHKRIGLSTNVFPMETRSKWYKRIGRMLDNNVAEYTREMAAVAQGR